MRCTSDPEKMVGANGPRKSYNGMFSLLDKTFLSGFSDLVTADLCLTDSISKLTSSMIHQSSSGI